MSLLYRFAKLPDRCNTHVYTFVVTKSVTRDIHRDVTSKEFVYGYQKWAITFSRTEKVLGVYLVWRNPSPGSRVFVDFSFTLLNREHFSANETFSGKQVKFTQESPAQGNRRYIPVHDLLARNFADRNGEFLLELHISGIRTLFEVDLRLPPPTYMNVYKAHHHHHNSSIRSHHGSSSGGSGSTSQQPKLETSYFNYGGFDWNVSVYPNGKERGEERLLVFLSRLTGFDHQCRVRYMMVLGEGERRIDSGLLDDISDTDGKSYGWAPRIRLADLIHRGVLRIHLEMVTANTLSEVGLVAGLSNGSSLPVQCYDREKQAWTLETDTHSEVLRVRLVHKDVHNVPRNHLRYTSWSAYLLRFNSKTGLLDPVAFTHAPYSNYYVQEEADDGILLETDVTVKEIRDPSSFYLNEKGQVRVQIEWGESYLLFQATYHKYDDVTRVHNYQMRKEISALQAENYSLERQLFSYQKSIAYAHSSSGTTSTGTGGGSMGVVPGSNSPALPGSRVGSLVGGGSTGGSLLGGSTSILQERDEDEQQQQGDDSSATGNNANNHTPRSFILDRSISTESEYA